MYKLLVIPFIIRLYARFNVFISIVIPKNINETKKTRTNFDMTTDS